jgi:ABC-type nitrate/sulfonate/bicarbonate transport system ATPase subunit
LRDVSFAYPNGTVAVTGITLQVPHGRRIGIVGPSGCGKSTLLALVAGLNRPTSGELEVNRQSSDRHPVSMVFQKDTLLPWLTAEQNVNIFYRFHRPADRAEVRRRSAELIRMAGLEGFESAYPYQLSGGMRRRVAFLAGVAARPEILLLDEPFSALDEPTRVAIHQDVFDIVRDLGMTVVLVTHDLAEAVSLCDEVLILSARPGTIVTRHEMPFGAERNMLELRQTPEFLDCYGTLWHELGLQIAASRAAAAAAQQELGS